MCEAHRLLRPGVRPAGDASASGSGEAWGIIALFVLGFAVIEGVKHLTGADREPTMPPGSSRIYRARPNPDEFAHNLRRGEMVRVIGDGAPKEFGRVLSTTRVGDVWYVSVRYKDRDAWLRSDQYRFETR